MRWLVTVGLLVLVRITYQAPEMCMTPECDNLRAIDGDACCVRALMPPDITTETGGLWPQECAALHDFLFDFDFQNRQRRADHLRQLPFQCMAWRQMRGSASVKVLTKSTLKRPTETAFNYYYDIVDRLIDFLPGGIMRWSQFTTLSLQRGLCDAYNSRKKVVDKSAWKPHCGWDEWKKNVASGSGGTSLAGCDCMAILEANTKQVYERYSPSSRTDKELLKEFFQIGGFVVSAQPLCVSQAYEALPLCR